MAKNIILDALIPREEFEVKSDSSATTRNIHTIGVKDLEYESFFFLALRKPDFQRETNEWDAKRIVSLIESFISGDLIPAIILWRNRDSNTFVIDGAHRLSALAAWINDDYGDKEISKRFFDGQIPEEQISSAESTRKLIRKTIGAFSDYKLAITQPDKVEKHIVDKAKSMGTLAIQVQWVEGDAANAENSFFKINQQAVSISKTELKLLKYRRKPNGIASRAILRSGKGHKYWSSYQNSIQNEIQQLAKEINEIIFQPSLKNPIKTLDLPLGGRNLSSQGQSLILELVNRANDIENIEEIENDQDGQITIQYLKRCLKLVRRINSIHPSSLGLHPVIYFYSKNGRHKPTSFWATVEFVNELEKTKKLNWFIDVRSRFEDFLLKYDYIVQQIGRDHRTGSDAYTPIKDFYIAIINLLHKGFDLDEVPKEIRKLEQFKSIALKEMIEDDTINPEFSRENKSEVFIREALKNPVLCSICGSRIHQNSITIDHVVRKSEGGTGSVDNGQIAHPYCNTTYKH